MFLNVCASPDGHRVSEHLETSMFAATASSANEYDKVIFCGFDYVRGYFACCAYCYVAFGTLLVSYDGYYEMISLISFWLIFHRVCVSHRGVVRSYPSNVSLQSLGGASAPHLPSYAMRRFFLGITGQRHLR
jgi:hypothetical protein